MKKFLVFVVICAIAFYSYNKRYQSFLSKLAFYNQKKPQTADLLDEKPLDGLTMEESVMIGWSQDHITKPKTSYLNTPYFKKPGVIRIGVFGCSFVQGREVTYGFDFCSLTQDEFRKHGINNIEVINFGVDGYGMHQSYLLWEYAGKKYNLDYAVFMVFDFHFPRDNSFIFHTNWYGSVHARYILHAQDVKLIPVYGKTRKHARKKYFSMLPPYRYIRYDHRMPVFLKALMPESWRSRSNPFYYRACVFNKQQRQQREVIDTYKILFNRLCKDVSQVVIIGSEKILNRFRNEIDEDNIHFIDNTLFEYMPEGPMTSVYMTQTAHWSELTHQIVAKKLSAWFMQKQDFEYFRLAVPDKSAGLNKNTADQIKKPLYQYKDIGVYINDRQVADFYWPLRDFIFLEKVNFKTSKISSLVEIPGGRFMGNFLLNDPLQFIPLPYLLEPSENVYLRFYLDKEPVKIPIGKVEASSNVLGEFTFKPDYKRDRDWDITRTASKNSNEIIINSVKEIENIAIVLGNKLFLKAVDLGTRNKPGFNKKYKYSKRVRFVPEITEFIYVRSPKQYYVDVENMRAEKGTVDLVTTEKGKEYRSVLFAFKREKQKAKIHADKWPIRLGENK